MTRIDAVIAVCPDHDAANLAVKELTESGFKIKNRGVVGSGYRTEEVVCAVVVNPVQDHRRPRLIMSPMWAPESFRPHVQSHRRGAAL